MLTDVVQDCNLNFLLGSGLSCPYLKTLGQIEMLLTCLEQASLGGEQEKIIRCSLCKAYFDDVMSKNCKILEGHTDADKVLDAYDKFLKTINTILMLRKSSILSKQANLFTTNIDIFLEKALERGGFECNDGFNGRFDPWFSTSNFKKSHFKTTAQYDNRSELPTVNLLKLHGSLTWKRLNDDRIGFSVDLNHVRGLLAMAVTPALVLAVDESTRFDALVTSSAGKRPDATVDAFLSAYDELLIVNPRKSKFRETVLNQTHYDLLRIYSNELEKENTILFVLGFSFADEHLRTITMRAAHSNPTLLIKVLAYDSKSAAELRERLRPPGLNNNIEILAPPLDDKGVGRFKYDLDTINDKILRQIIGWTAVEKVTVPTAENPA